MHEHERKTNEYTEELEEGDEKEEEISPVALQFSNGLRRRASIGGSFESWDESAALEVRRQYVTQV